MNTVYAFLPSYIPAELHFLIHVYAGTCTPSCEHMKIYIDYIKRNRFKTINNTLWSTQITWDIPIYMKRWVAHIDLSIVELDMKVAWHVLKYEQFLAGKLNITTFEYVSEIEWFHMEVEKVKKDLTKRLFNSLEKWSKTEDDTACEK